MADAHIETARVLEEMPEIQEQYERIGVRPQGATWADDLAVPVLADGNAQLVPNTIKVMQRLQHIFKKKGLTINYKKGKTVAVPTFRGKGAPALRKHFMHREESTVPIPLLDLPTGQTVDLRIASAYKHLGVMYTPEAGYAVEMGQRLGQASAAYNELKRPIFANKHISTSTRLRLLDALVFTKLLFGAALWHDLHKRSLDRLEGFIMKTIRQVVAAGFASGALTDEQIRSQYELPTLRQRLARVRLLYVAKLWKEGPETLHKLIEIEHQHVVPSWKTQILKDVEWLRSVYAVDLGHEITWEQLTQVWRDENNEKWGKQFDMQLDRSMQWARCEGGTTTSSQLWGQWLPTISTPLTLALLWCKRTAIDVNVDTPSALFEDYKFTATRSMATTPQSTASRLLLHAQIA